MGVHLQEVNLKTVNGQSLIEEGGGNLVVDGVPQNLQQVIDVGNTSTKVIKGVDGVAQEDLITKRQLDLKANQTSLNTLEGTVNNLDQSAVKSVNGINPVSGNVVFPVGIPEAPEDGKTYGRKDAIWQEVVVDVSNLATKVELSDSLDLKANKLDVDADLLQINTEIGQVEQSLSTKIGEAPSDGKQYARQDEAWSEVVSSTDYELPVASPSILGGIKIGNGLSILPDGTVSVEGGGGGSDLPLLYDATKMSFYQNLNDLATVGLRSIAIGGGNNMGTYDTANAKGLNSISIGVGSSATSGDSVIIGYKARSGNNSSSSGPISIGSESSAGTTGCISIGRFASSGVSLLAFDGVAIGASAKAYGKNSLALKGTVKSLGATGIGTWGSETFKSGNGQTARVDGDPLFFIANNTIKNNIENPTVLIDNNDNTTFLGDVEVASTVPDKGFVMTSPNGTRYRLSVSDEGEPVFTAL